MSQRLSKTDRLHRQQDLARVFRKGRSATDRLLRLHVIGNDLGRARMAVTVSLRHGNAVRRNRLKRLCREAFRTARADLPGGHDYVLRPTYGSDPTLEELRRSLRNLAARLIREGDR